MEEDDLESDCVTDEDVSIPIEEYSDPESDRILDFERGNELYKEENYNDAAEW